MPNICDNYVCVTGPEDVLLMLETRSFHWSEYFPDMPEERCVRMATERSEDAPPIRLMRNGSGGIEAFFISAWSPPIHFYNRLVERFEEIRLEYEYHEWRMGFAGFGQGSAVGCEPTHFSYECDDDISLMKKVHDWKLQISNPHFETLPVNEPNSDSDSDSDSESNVSHVASRAPK